MRILPKYTLNPIGRFTWKKKVVKKGHPQEGAGRNWSNTAVECFDSCQNQEGKERSSLETSVKAWPCQQPDFTLLATGTYEGINSLLKPPRFWQFDSHLFVDLEHPIKASVPSPWCSWKLVHPWASLEAFRSLDACMPLKGFLGPSSLSFSLLPIHREIRNSLHHALSVQCISLSQFTGLPMAWNFQDWGTQ